MAEIQDISQENQEINTAPTETVATNINDEKIVDITPKPKYRKQIYDKLKNDLYKNDPKNFSLSEQQFYKKLDSDQEYAKKVFKVLSTYYPPTEIAKDQDEFLTLLYEKDIKEINKTSSNAERPKISDAPIKMEESRGKQAREAIATQKQLNDIHAKLKANNYKPVRDYFNNKQVEYVYEGKNEKGVNIVNAYYINEEKKYQSTNVQRALIYREEKKENPNAVAPKLTEAERLALINSEELKAAKQRDQQPANAQVDGGYRFDIMPSKNNAFVLKGWDQIYNEYQDIVDNYGVDEEKVITTNAPKTTIQKTITGLPTKDFGVPGVNPATGQTDLISSIYSSANKGVLQRNAIREKYQNKIKEVESFIDKSVDNGINKFNYDDYLTKNRNGMTVASKDLVRILAKKLVYSYQGKDQPGFVEFGFTQAKSDQALENMFFNKLVAKIETFEKVEKSHEKGIAALNAAKVKLENKLLVKHNELQVKNQAEVDVFYAELKDKMNAEITNVTAPILEQGKVINETLEKLTNDFKSSTTFDKAVAEVPEIANIKFNYDMAIKSLSNGQYSQDEANKLANEAFQKYKTDVEPLYNQWQEGKFKLYQTAFNAEKQKIVELNAKAELEAGRIASRYDNQYSAFVKQKNEQADESMQSYVDELKKSGVDANLIKIYQNAYKETYEKLAKEENAKIEKNFTEAASKYFFGLDSFSYSWGAATVNNFGDALSNAGYQLNIPVLKMIGESFSNTYSLPDFEIKEWEEIFTNPIKLGGSVGQVTGRQLPMFLSLLVPVVGQETAGSVLLAKISNAAISGTVGFGFETVDMAGGMYRRVLSETGDPVKANLASWEIVNDNKKLWWTYGLEALPFIHNFKNFIKGTGVFSMAKRFALRGGIEATTETLLQEWYQGSSEDKTYLKYVRGANNITTYDMMFTNDKIIRDKYNNPLTDSRDGRGFYLTTGGLNRLKSTALNIAPASFLMGGGGSVLEYAQYKYSEQVGKNMFAKSKLSEMSDSFHKQQIFQILLTRGKNTASGYLIALNRSGKLTTDQFTNLVTSLDEMEGYSKMAERQKWKPEKTMAMAALNFEVSNITTQMQNAELTDQEKDMLSKKLDYAKRNLDDFIQGKKSDFVMAVIGNQLQILTYAQFDDLMADNDFVNNTKGTIMIKVAGSGINAQGEKIEEKAMKIFDIKAPTQEQIDDLERNGPPVMEVFANTEIPHLNNLVNDLEGRMNQAEEIDEKDMNSAIAGLYQQLQDILDNHYNTENGKRAAQMLMDTIEKFEDYEFTTKEETVDVTERTTTQGIREVVNATKNIFGRVTGTAKSGAKKFVKVVTGFKQQGKYSVEINEKDEVVLTPMSGAPIVLGSRKDLNGKVKFVGSSFSGKTGKISTITFRVNEANENGVMPEVTLSTADGFSYDELLDMAIDLRAMEVGEVTTEEFDNAVTEVVTGQKTVKTYPNMAKAEQKAKAKAEAEAQQQAAPEQAAPEQKPQQTPEQINQRVQVLQAQQEEELKAAQDMIKTSNIRSSGMTLSEAIKARDEKVKQIKAKYQVLIDNAKKGITEETQQAEETQQNKDVVDITSDNIEDLQNIPTENKFQKRVLNAIPNILKALGKIVPGVKVSIHLTTQSYRDSALKDSNGTNDGRGTKGYYYKASKTINIDLSKVKSMDGLITAFHESFHGMYKVLPQNLKDMLYKSIQTVIMKDGFRFSIKTKSYFNKFAKQYKSHQQQEEAVVEFLGHMASGGVTLTVPGYQVFMEALNKILDKIGLGSFKFTTSKQARDFAKGVVNAMKTGQDIGQLTTPSTQTQQGQEEISFRNETAKLFEQANNLKEMTQEAENTAEKRKFANERREMLAENPSVKLIDDNFKNIIDQLKQNEEFEFKGPCF